MRYFTFTNPLIYVFCFVSCFLTLNAQIYVDIDAVGNNDGTTWANAYTDLQDALVSANPGDDIWVADGTYKPSTTALGCGVCPLAYYTFFVNDGVSLYGGFTGTETSLEQRGSGYTVLDGNIAESGPVTNVHHVVLIYSKFYNSRIDGFEITGGNANGFGATSIVLGQDVNAVNGGGIYAFGEFVGSPSSKVIIENNQIYLNQAVNNGGGVYIDNIPTSLDGNSIFQNEANNNGGGVYSFFAGGNSTINRNGFGFNSADSNGGGAYLEGGNSTISGNVFRLNSANDNGGGLFILNEGGIIDNNNFEQNEAGLNGGGICMDGGSLNLSKNDILLNRAGRGSGIYAVGLNYTLDNNIVTGNHTLGNDGGVFIQSGFGTIINNTIVSNFSAATSDNSSSIYQNYIGNPLATSPDYEAPEMTFTGGTCAILNNIVWGQGDGIEALGGANLTVESNIIKQGFSGQGNLDQDPLFREQLLIEDPFGPEETYRPIQLLGLFSGSIKGLRLQLNSPAVENGDTTGYQNIIGDPASDTDASGGDRLIGLNVDLGALERQKPFTIAPNGITCLCPDAEIGESGTLKINGITKTFTKRTRAQLDALIANDSNDPEIGLTCTTNITNMNSLFLNNTLFNQDISSWDVSNVDNMANMFNNAIAFDQDISSWSVGRVVDMEAMFRNVIALSQDISSWNVSKVITMRDMFAESNFNQDISNWDVSNVSEMDGMFNNSTFSQDISDWCVQDITTEPLNFDSGLLGPAFKPSWGVQCKLFDLAPNGITCLCPDATIGESGSVIINGVSRTVTKRTRAQLDALIANDQNDPQIALTCTTGITDMSNLFGKASSFNQNISSWDVSSVINMNGMFNQAFSFNQPLFAWDVSNVNNMNGMFRQTFAFNQEISDWNISNVTDMSSMFRSALAFNQPLHAWNVFNVTDMGFMFAGAVAFNQHIGNWNTSNVTNMNSMFRQASSFNQPLHAWNVSNVTDMGFMFANASAFNKNISTWCVEYFAIEPNGFSLNSALQPSFKPFWGLCPSPDFIVLDPNGQTCLCPDAAVGDSGVLVINGEPKIFTKRDRVDVGFVTGLENLILNDETDSQIALTCTSGITDMSNLFENKATFNQDISSWDVSNVTNMSSMFSQASGYNQPLNIWDTSNVTNMSQMFQGAIDFNQPLNDWDVSNVTNMTSMFFNATSFDQNISSWCVELILIEPSDFSTNSLLQLDFNPIWGSCPNPDFIIAPNGVTCLCPDANFGDSATIVLDGVPKIFTKRNRSQLDTLIANDQADPQIALTCTSGIADMSNLFLNRTTFNQDLKYWDVSNVILMDSMFQNALAFNQPLNNWNVSSVTNMFAMFFDATAFDQTLNDWDVSNVTDMSEMFGGFDSQTIFNQPLNSWNVSQVTNMSGMFAKNINFNQPLYNWDVSNVTNMSSMFRLAEAFDQPLNDWDVSTVTDMSLMFFEASVFNKPLIDWDVSNVTNMESMFEGASGFNQDISNWCVAKIPSEPASFSFASPIPPSFKPNWGTCLNPNFILAPNGLTCLCPDAIIGNSGTLEIGGVSKTFTKRTRAQLISLIANDQADPQIALTCTSGITDMSNLFLNRTTFNQDLKYWDVSKTINMREMFRGASAFNQSLNHWDVSETINMREMFRDASAFNQPLNSWDVSSVTNMSGMFKQAFSFNQPVNVWDVSSVTTMNGMFSFASAFNQPINDWDVYNVTNMSAMFEGASVFSQDISNWCVENITSEPSNFSTGSLLQSSFKPNWGTCLNPNFILAPNGVTCLCPDATIGKSGALEIGGVSKTFTKRSRSQLDTLIANDQADPQIALTCTSGITDMSNLFLNRTTFNQDLKYWDVSKTINMREMFRGASAFNQSLNHWDVSETINMLEMFRDASAFNQPLNSWDVSSVINMSLMFSNATAFDQPLHDWDVSSVINMFAMFSSADVFNQPLNDWDVSNVTDMASMFLIASSFNQDISSWCVENITSEPSFFSTGSLLQSSFKPNWGTCLNQNFILAPNGVTCLCPDATIGEIGDLEIGGVSKTFTKRSRSQLDTLIANDQADPQIALTCTSGITDMSNLFEGSNSFNQDISSWDVSNVTTMSSMFSFANAFNQALNDWDVSKVTDMNSMFRNSNFNQPLNNLDVSNVTDMQGMFFNASAFNQALNEWDVSNVTNMEAMFRNNSDFNQPLHDWDVSQVTDMNFMFLDSVFNQDLSSWCVEKIPSEPALFSIGSPLPASFKPNWGIFGSTCSFVYKNSSWSPNHPLTGTITSTSSNLIKIVNGTAILNGELLAKDLIINSGANLDLGSSAIINLNGDMRNDGTLTFGSDSSGSAQLDTFDGTISGNGDLTIERFIPAGDNNKRAFRLLTSSVNTTGSIYENWQENGSTPSSPDGLGTHITGGLASDGFDQSGSNNPSMFTFDNTNANGTANQNDDWSALPNTNIKSLKAGEAYLTFVRGDRSIDVTSNSATPTNTTLRATGALHTGTFSPVLSSTAEHYSLVANPYQAIIDFRTIDFENIYPIYHWVWDPSIGLRGNYATVYTLPTGGVFNSNANSQANQYIQPGQSFFVQTIANNTASLTFNEDDKVTSAVETTVFSEQSNPSISLLFYTTNAFNSGDRESDGLLINFNENANNNVDLMDADKLFGSYENIARLNSGEFLSIENRDEPIEGEVLPLSTTGYTEDNYTLIANSTNIQGNFEAYLIDNYTATQTQLIEGATQVNYTVDTNIPESTASDRFSLVFDNTTLGVDENTFGEDFSLFPNPAKDGQFSIKTPNLSGEVKVKLNNIMGQIVLNETLTIVGSEVNVNANNLASGVHIVELSQNEQSYSTKLIVE